MFYYDETMLLVLLGILLTGLASASMNATFQKYSKIRNSRNIAGYETAQRILNTAGIYDVRVEAISGNLTDHYHPGQKTVSLSEPIYGQSSLSALGVAAHECGHAIQHQNNYLPLQIRTAIVPVANIGSSLSMPIFILGLVLSIPPLLKIGIFLFSFAVLFQLVTLPVEFNASSRALAMIRSMGLVDEQELKGIRKVLRAAAMTYVAAAAASALQLLRLIILSGGRNRD
ncbi:MAG TPA: zinc metallopeptidase [Lachnospiraceae bacterium]